MTQRIPICDKCQQPREGNFGGKGDGTYQSKKIKVKGKPALICGTCKEKEDLKTTITHEVAHT